MIAGRLLSMHEKGKRVLGVEATKRYTGLLAILVESALPFTVLGVVYLALYIKSIPESLAFADIWGCFVAMSPQAIILRVAMGTAWTPETFTRVHSGIELAPVENINNNDPERDRDDKYSSSSHV